MATAVYVRMKSNEDYLYALDQTLEVGDDVDAFVRNQLGDEIENVDYILIDHSPSVNEG